MMRKASQSRLLDRNDSKETTILPNATTPSTSTSNIDFLRDKWAREKLHLEHDLAEEKKMRESIEEQLEQIQNAMKKMENDINNKINIAIEQAKIKWEQEHANKYVIPNGMIVRTVAEQKACDAALLASMEEKYTKRARQDEEYMEREYQKMKKLEEELRLARVHIKTLEDWKREAQLEKDRVADERRRLQASITVGQQAQRDSRRYQILLRYMCIHRFVNDSRTRRSLHQLHTSISRLVYQLMEDAEFCDSSTSVQSEIGAWYDQAVKLMQRQRKALEGRNRDVEMDNVVEAAERDMKPTEEKVKSARRGRSRHEERVKKPSPGVEIHNFLKHLADVHAVLQLSIDSLISTKRHWKQTSKSFFERNAELTSHAMKIENDLSRTTKEVEGLKKRNHALHSALEKMEQKYHLDMRHHHIDSSSATRALAHIRALVQHAEEDGEEEPKMIIRTASRDPFTETAASSHRTSARARAQARATRIKQAQEMEQAEEYERTREAYTPLLTQHPMATQKFELRQSWTPPSSTHPIRQAPESTSFFPAVQSPSARSRGPTTNGNIPHAISPARAAQIQSQPQQQHLTTSPASNTPRQHQQQQSQLQSHSQQSQQTQQQQQLSFQSSTLAPRTNIYRLTSSQSPSHVHITSHISPRPGPDLQPLSPSSHLSPPILSSTSSAVQIYAPGWTSTSPR